MSTPPLISSDPAAPCRTQSAPPVVGDGALLPGAAAVAQAIHRATGVRVRDLPTTRDEAVRP